MKTRTDLLEKGHTPRRFWRTAVSGASTLLLLVIAAAVAWDGAGHPSWAVPLDCGVVQRTPYFTIAYGHVQIDGVNAAPGTQVEAYSPRGDLVGCFVVQTEGLYGAMFVYGEDASISPPIPGMRHGESVLFRVNGVSANTEPVLTWANDLDLHEITLAVGDEATPEPTQTLTSTMTPTTPPTDTVIPPTPIPTTPRPTVTVTPSPPTPTPAGPGDCGQCVYLPMIQQ